MTTGPDLSRRAMLRILAGAPLPMAGFPLLSFLDAGAAGAAGDAARSVECIGMPAPPSQAAQAATTVESSLLVTYRDGARQPHGICQSCLSERAAVGRGTSR
jgi:hypothetical protein